MPHGPELALRCDLRAPDFGAPAAALYAAALDQCEWADRRGFSRVLLGEHHGRDDGYLSAPVVLAAAIAGRTSVIRLQPSALVLPLHDPVEVAEELAVLDLVSGGRVDVLLGAGYLESEYASLGRSFSRRGSELEAGIDVLRRAWTGAPFEWRGRRVRVTPRPLQDPHPRLFLGGSSPASARRAVRLADGYFPTDSALHDIYRLGCERLGRVPYPIEPRPAGPMFLHVAFDPERAWARIAPHALHEVNSYGAWLAASVGHRRFQPVEDAAELWRKGSHRVVTPEDCVSLARGLGSSGRLILIRSWAVSTRIWPGRASSSSTRRCSRRCDP